MANDGIALTTKVARAAAVAVAGATRGPASGAVSTTKRNGDTPPSRSLQIEQADLEEKLAAANQFLAEQRSSLHFSIDKGTGKTVVRIVRQSTGEVVRQIPSEEALAIASSLRAGGTLSSLGVEAWS